MTIKTRYYWLNNGRHYYQRAVPKDLQKYFENKPTIQRRLTGAESSIVREIQRHAEADTALFRRLRSTSSKDEAQRLLALHGLQPGAGLSRALVPPGMYDQPHLDDIEHYLSVREQAGSLTEADLLARKLLIEPAPLLLSDAIELYFGNHDRGKDEKFRHSAQRSWHSLIAVVGDIPLVELNRQCAKAYVAARLGAGVTTTTVQRNTNDLKAIVRKCLAEAEISSANPFDNLHIPNINKDATKRIGFTIAETRQLIGHCQSNADEIPTLLLICIVTGCRISEAVGLRWCDVDLGSEVPSLTFTEYGSRTLKTANSARTVPLLEVGVSALTRLKATAPDSSVLFPRYCDEAGIRGTNASNSVANLIRRLGIDKTAHCARHTMRDLLRNSDCPEPIIDQIGGWSKDNVGQHYGQGYSLGIMQRHLRAAYGLLLD